MATNYGGNWKQADSKNCNRAEYFTGGGFKPSEAGWRVSTGKPAKRKSSYGTSFHRKGK